MRFSPSCACCGSSECPCPCLRILFTNAGNGCCLALEGTEWLLPQVDDGECRTWRGDWEDFCEDPIFSQTFDLTIQVVAQEDVGDTYLVIVSVNLVPTTGFAQRWAIEWRKNFDMPIDCTQWVDEVISYDHSAGVAWCGGHPTTSTVTINHVCCRSYADIEPDGSELSDDFSVDSGWTADNAGDHTYYVSGGRGYLDYDSGAHTSHRIYLTHTISTMDLFFVSLEVVIYEPTDVEQSGLFWSSVANYALTADFVNGKYVATAFGTPVDVAVTPISGDKLTIAISRIGASTNGDGDSYLQVCFYVNETLVAYASGYDTFSGSTEYGMHTVTSTPPVITVGEWDNFLLQVGA